MEQCKKEKCPYLPICGAGCPWDAMVADDKLGFGVRSCRKRTIDIINRGLLRLNHSE
jgi:radical SAM protein with 4Fe4S-binding SPASM domain